MKSLKESILSGSNSVVNSATDLATITEQVSEILYKYFAKFTDNFSFNDIPKKLQYRRFHGYNGEKSHLAWHVLRTGIMRRKFKDVVISCRNEIIAIPNIKVDAKWVNPRHFTMDIQNYEPNNGGVPFLNKYPNITLNVGAGYDSHPEISFEEIFLKK